MAFERERSIERSSHRVRDPSAADHEYG
jgi:hypothetical protein